jgi:hypothetical protein
LNIYYHVNGTQGSSIYPSSTTAIFFPTLERRYAVDIPAAIPPPTITTSIEIFRSNYDCTQVTPLIMNDKVNGSKEIQLKLCLKVSIAVFVFQFS